MTFRSQPGAPRPSYGEAVRDFRWADSMRALGWTPGGDVSLGETLVDRHAASGRSALSWLGKDGSHRAYTFGELSRLSNRFANLLRSLGVDRGDRVAGYLPRVPETLVVMLGAWKAGAIYVPIFTGFGPDAIAYRMAHSRARILCTHWEHASHIPDPLPGGAHLITVTRPGETAPGATSFEPAMAAQSDRCEPARVRREDPAVLLYTSGSTGPPKGVQIAANFLLAIHPSMRYGVDLRADDVFWPTGDPGWGYGLVCYMLALAMGVTVSFQEAAPTAERCLERLRDAGVTNLAATPTLLRSLMALGAEAVRRYPVRVRAASCCGEPLNAEVVTFFREQWGVTVMDHYGSSELGLPIGNFNAIDMAVKPGSMGRPLPGCTAAIVDDEGREVADDVVGHVGVQPHPEGYYSLGYWDDPERTRALYRGPWMTCGDLARRDSDGYFWFEGRADDVIKSAGYRIGPFEVESALLMHPAVAEAAVVGVPDALRGHIVKAYVVLKAERVPYPGLEDELVDVVKTHVGRHQYPRAIELLDELPKTETGKIQRFLLRQRP
jgi:acetyl-CoA synthetase